MPSSMYEAYSSASDTAMEYVTYGICHVFLMDSSETSTWQSRRGSDMIIHLVCMHGQERTAPSVSFTRRHIKRLFDVSAQVVFMATGKTETELLKRWLEFNLIQAIIHRPGTRDMSAVLLRAMSSWLKVRMEMNTSLMTAWTEYVSAN